MDQDRKEDIQGIRRAIEMIQCRVDEIVELVVCQHQLTRQLFDQYQMARVVEKEKTNGNPNPGHAKIVNLTIYDHERLKEQAK